MRFDFGKLIEHPFARRVAGKLGVPQGVQLRRGRGFVTPVVATAVGSATLVADTLTKLGVEAGEPVRDVPEARSKDESGRDQPPRYDHKIGGIVVDATGLREISELEHVRAVLRPAVRAVSTSGRVVVVGMRPDTLDESLVEQRAAQNALDGLTRTVAKELRGGATANLLQVSTDTTPEALAAPLRFFLEGRSAYVDGQALAVGTGSDDGGGDGSFDGRVVVVTGAARGIGAEIARTFARDGARVVAVDVPAAGENLAKVANEIRGTALQLDITADDAGARIAEHVTSRFGADTRIYAIIHNAGITRDKMLVNLDDAKWAAVLEVNLAAQIRINDVLLDPALPGGLADGGRIIGVASTVGIAGNKGQANYSASKAGVIGVVRALAPRLAGRGITVNAVAPGFIETEMTARIPALQREIFRKSNSLAQGGLPPDVAETICFLAAPDSGAITGQIVRVCGQNLVGQ